MALGLRIWWRIATVIGMRRLIRLVHRGVLSSTLFHFSEAEAPNVAGMVALTIDDGLCRNGESRALVDEVRELLREFNAKVTFFLCSDYVVGLESVARTLLEDGHEFANHCPEDRSYSRMPFAEFKAELAKTNRCVEDLTGAPAKWFRAPMAKLSKPMRAALEEQDMRNVFMDAYCDDWAIEDPAFIARTVLAQAQSGSILDVHMPERGFREHTLEALRGILQGLSARGLRCVTLSELALHAEGCQAEPTSSEAAGIGAGGIPSAPAPHARGSQAQLSSSDVAEVDGRGAPSTPSPPAEECRAELASSDVLEIHDVGARLVQP